MLNAFTIDVEEWFCSHNLQQAIPFTNWPQQERRAKENVRRILLLLKEYNVEATFFILGWVAEREPDLIQEIESAGHEIASHGYAHRQITCITPDDFKRDIDRFLKVMQPIVQQKILGYRAPAFSITKKTLWALDVLKESGFEYDSSIFPVGIHPDYGIADALLKPYFYENSLVEIPLSCVEFASKRIPCSGGGYFRLYPYPVFKKLLKSCNDAGRSGIFYLHPWEIDGDSPHVPLPFFKRFRHYQNVDKTYSRLEKLLEDFAFTSIRNLLKSTDITSFL